MRRMLMIVGLSCALGVAAFWAGSRVPERKCFPDSAQRADIEWLRREFALGDEAFGRVRVLHEEYKPVCEDLCRRVVENRRRIDELAEGYSGELDAALREAADLRFESQRLYLRHVGAVAACMAPEQARRYTAMMRARVFEDCGCRGGMCLH